MAGHDAAEGDNAVHLVGRVSASPEPRTMPSGDTLVTFRVVVPRSAVRARAAQGRAGVDAIDIACWSARTRGSAAWLAEGDVVEVHGSLRRRFFATGAGRASRYEVEASRVHRRRR